MSFLFLSGEVSVSLPMCVRRASWQHTIVARAIRPEGERVAYGAIPKRFEAVLWYCSVDDDELRLGNERALRESGVPCWPSLDLLEKWGDRRDKLQAAAAAGLVDDVLFAHATSLDKEVAARDTVVKVGNLHVGEGKILVRAGELFPLWDGLASVEPFVEGRSVRAYVVGDRAYGVEYTNDLSWIKNGPGADTFEVELGNELEEHAKRAHALYGFPVSGVDYIVRPDGSFRVLEHKHFPGVTLHAEAEEAIKAEFERAMKALEAEAGRR